MNKVDDGGYVHPTIEGQTWTREEGITLLNQLADNLLVALIHPDYADMTPDDQILKLCELSKLAYMATDHQIAEGGKGES